MAFVSGNVAIERQRRRVGRQWFGRRRDGVPAVVEAIEDRMLLSSAVQARFDGEETASVAGVPVPFTVQLLDDQGLVDTTANGPVTLSVYQGPGGVALSGTVSVHAVRGIATFDGVDLYAAGTYELEASAPGILPGISADVRVGPATPARLAFQHVPAMLFAGGNFSEYDGADLTTLEVDAIDPYGNFTTDVATTVTVTATGGDTATVTGSGQISVTRLVATHVGVQTLTATAPGLTPAISPSFTVDAAGTAAFAFTAQPTDHVAGQTLPTGLVHTVDGYGNPTTSFDGHAVSVALVQAGHPVDPVAATVVDGNVVLPDGFDPTAPGTYQLQVNDARYSLAGGGGSGLTGTLSSIESDPFTVAAGPAATLVPVDGSESYQAEAGHAFGPVAFDVEDAYGNVVPTRDGATVTVTATGTALGGTPAEPVTGTIATFADLSIRAVGTFTLTATAASLAPATVSVTVLPDLLPAQQVAAGRSIGALTVDLASYLPDLNARSFRRGDVTATLRSEDDPKFITKGAYPGLSHGGFRVTVPPLREPGRYDITVSDVDRESVSTEFTVVPAAPARLNFAARPTVAADGTLAAAVSLTDRYGNPATNAAGDTVTLAYGGPAGRGVPPVLGGTTVGTVDARGKAIFLGLTLPRVRHARLVATFGGLRPVRSASFDVG